MSARRKGPRGRPGEVYTTSAGQPYIITECGPAKFITYAEARRLGWTGRKPTAKPAAKPASKPAAKPASKPAAKPTAKPASKARRSSSPSQPTLFL